MTRPQRNRPRLHWYDLETGEPARKGITGASYADIEDGSGRYERRGQSKNFTAVFIDSDGNETVLPKEGSQDLAQNVSENAAYRAHVSHYYGPAADEELGLPDSSAGAANEPINTGRRDSVDDAAALLAELSEIRVDVHDDGRRVPYKYVVLVWAISQALSSRGQPQLLQRFKFQDVSSELAALLKPFHVSASRPDPRNPWFALKETPLWWDLTLPNTAGVTYKQTRELNLEGGLSEDAFRLVVDDTDFAARAIQAIVNIIGDSPEVRDLLTELRLDGATTAGEQLPVVRKIPVESHVAEDFAAEYKALGRQDRTRKEAKLQKRYEKYLKNTLGHEVCRHEIRIDSQVLYTDLFDETTDELIEVKSSIERSTMRLALGQILDYAQVLRPTHCAVLVPTEPAQGVIELFRHHGVRVVWRSGDAFISRDV